MAKERPKRRIVQPCLEYNRGLLHEEELALRKALYASLVDAKKGPGKCTTEAESDGIQTKTCASHNMGTKRSKPAEEEALEKTSTNDDSEICVTSNTTTNIATGVVEPARRFSTEMKLELKKRHINLLKQSSKLVRSAIKKQKKMAMKSRQPLKGKLLKSGLAVKTTCKDRTAAVSGTKAKRESNLQTSERGTVKKFKRKRKESKLRKLANELETKTSETNTSLSLNEEQLRSALDVKKKKRRRKKLSKCQQLDFTGNKDVDVSSDSSPAKKPRKERKKTRSKRVIHAQRKFARSRPLTLSSLKLQQETFEIQATRANTEDFLTFLCLRGQSSLPKDLEIFNNPCAPVSPLSSEDDDESSYMYSPSPSQSQALSPAPSSSQLDSSNMSTLSPASHVDSVAHCEKHALKAQAEFYQGMAGGTRAHSEDQKLYETQLTDTDDDTCLSITPPLTLGNTSLPPSVLDTNCNSDQLPRPLPVLLPGNSGSSSTTSSVTEHVIHPPPPLIAPGGSTVAPTQQQCCSPPPLLYIPVAAQKVTHLHGPPELKRFPPTSSTDSDSAVGTKTTFLETNLQNEDSMAKNGKQLSNSKHEKVDDKLHNSISAQSVPSEDTIPTNMAQIQSTKSSEPSRAFVSINEGRDISKHLPLSVDKPAEGLHLAGSPTRFRGMLEEFSYVIHKQPNPCVVTPDENNTKSFASYHSSTEGSKVRCDTRPFDGVNKPPFAESHSPPPLRHILNTKEREQRQSASPPQLTPVTPRNESPSFTAETATNVNAHFNPTRPSPLQIYPSDVHVGKTPHASLIFSQRSTPSPPKFTPVTPNLTSSYLTDVHRVRTHLNTPSPPKLTAITPSLVCSNPFETSTSWMPVLNRMPVRSNAGHPYAHSRQQDIGCVTGYPANRLQRVAELGEPRTRGIPSSLPLGAGTSVQSHFYPTSDYSALSRSSTPPRDFNISQIGPLRSTVLTRTVPMSLTVPRTLLQRPLTSTEIIIPGRNDLVIQQQRVPFTQGGSSVKYQTGNQSQFNCQTPQCLEPHSIFHTQSSHSYPLTVEMSRKHFQPQTSSSGFSNNVSQVNNVASLNCFDVEKRGTVASVAKCATKSFHLENISSRTDCAHGASTAEPTSLLPSEKGIECASVTNAFNSIKQKPVGMKRIGRPPGSRNKPKPATNSATALGNNNQGSDAAGTVDLTGRHALNAYGKKRIGRPPGSKNKPKAIRDCNVVSNSPTDSGIVLERGSSSQIKLDTTRKGMGLNCEDSTTKYENVSPCSTHDAEGSSLNCKSKEKANSSNFSLPSSDSGKKSGTIPVFHPSEEEFKDPMQYLETVVRQAEEQGVCVVVPPVSSKPGFDEAENMRFSTECQLIHKLKDRFVPVEQKLACIKHHMQEQDISLSPMPQIGGYELDLPQFSSVVKQFGGIEKLNDRKSWMRVADMLRIPTAVQDRLGRLQSAYIKYLLPYDLLSEENKESLAERVKSEKELSQFSSKGPNEEGCSSETSCFQKGRSMSLVVYQRTARNIQEHFFKNNPTVDEVESEYWKMVESGDRYTCVHRGVVDSEHESCFSTSKGNPFSRSGWNLNFLPHLPSSVLRHFGLTPAITIPWVQLDMALSTSGWQTNPLDLCHIDYLHMGADKIWYSVPACQEKQFITALSDCTGIQHPPGNTERRLDFMASLESLHKKGISVNRVVQKPGQFVVTLPKAYHCTIGCGFSIAEAVAFAPRGWIRDGNKIYEELSRTPQFYEASYEKLIIGAAEQLNSDDQDLTISVFDELARIRDKEITSRKQMLELGLTVTDSSHLNTSNEGNSGKRSLKSNAVHLCEECGRPCFFSAIIYEEDSSVFCHKDAANIIREQNSPDGFKIVTRYDMSKLDRVMGKLQGELDKGDPQTQGDRATQGDPQTQGDQATEGDFATQDNSSVTTAEESATS